VVHCVEEVINIINDLKLKTEDQKVYKVQSGKGIAAVEAPRGILIHQYEIDRQGRIVKANIITPTVMFLGNLEDDLAEYLKETKQMTEAERRNKIKMLIRAYDPCISCATH
jgi:coenzyme F420-reducing hydrogenase alpha subunit